MGVPNRLAREGEELVVYRFQTGSMGMASADDLECLAAEKAGRKGFWTKVKDFFCMPDLDAVCAVCIPPGARLELHELNTVKPVVFTQTNSTPNMYRDALRFADGKTILLQKLSEGLRVRVVDLSEAASIDLEALVQEREQVWR
jgi:hypothetical protein